ncbi:hypothetical protein RSAG8_13602, partial [Rhizoctonia solani AG-8 WAC10335]
MGRWSVNCLSLVFSANTPQGPTTEHCLLAFVRGVQRLLPGVIVYWAAARPTDPRIVTTMIK